MNFKSNVIKLLHDFNEINCGEVVCKDDTSGKEYTALQIIKEIENNSPVGKMFLREFIDTTSSKRR